ncbi:PD-(D/E)XK nuclease family protein [uncultured Olegusella sp.]|uniref:PDDEXK-like family protein n=1 Tax=uncultured Olegusella sp. TaxID=1979846 RepID=UPI002616A684|nr:PD-(D/E)XK nuclease family protein [uncultured Olegusella sp.]
MKNQIKALLSKLSDLHEAEQKRIKQEEEEGKNFNIISALQLCSDEVRLHSRLLAVLLNPKAKHGLGDKFLKSFLLAVGLPQDYILYCKEPMVERSVGEVTDTIGGRIDIILEDSNQKHAVIIENKIYANDQPNQLLRYHNYGKEQFGEHNFMLIYLTLDGCEPSDYSLGREKFELIKVSYARDILKLLEDLAQSIPPKPVRSTIEDYIKIIKQLTYQDVETEYKNNLIKEAADDIEGASELLSLAKEIGDTLVNNHIIKPLTKIGFEQHHDDNGALWKDLDESNVIVIKTDDKTYWKNVWIGITSKAPIPHQTKLDCFTDEPTQSYPYGWSWISDDGNNNWNNPVEYPAIKKGVVLEWIEKKVAEIETYFNVRSCKQQ